LKEVALRGIGSSTGAITIVNALATGIGAAAAIELPVEAEVDVLPAGSEARPLAIDPGSDSPLTRATLATALRLYFPGGKATAHLAIRSSIPPARGLKSSSAVGAAIVDAVARAAGARPSTEVLARAAASVAEAIGLSATGAFDDALASLEGGVVVTDNTWRSVIRRGLIDPKLCVVLWIPPTPHAPSSQWAEAFQGERTSGTLAADAAREGRWTKAMEINSALVERVMGYDYRALRDDLGRRGALASGVSGMGPTLAVLVPPEHLVRVESGLPAGEGEIRTVPFRAPTAAEGGV
jgi:shikimate kinase